MWSHHEKILVVDQSIAYVGGLDLCYGRMDTNNHPLFDEAGDNDEWFPGCDYANTRIRDWRNVELYMCCDIKKNEEPRMPWHDIHVKL